MKRSDIPFKLPPGVQPKHNAFYFIEAVKVGDKWKHTWTRLCAIADGEAALYAALGIAKAPPAAKGNFGDAITDFKKHYLPARSLTSRGNFERMLDKIAIAFADFNVDQPDANDIVEFAKQFGVHKTAARHYKSLLSTFFRWTIIKRMRTTNPCEHVRLDKPPRKPLRWTPETFNAIRNALLTLNHKGAPRDAGVMMQCYMDLSYLLYQRATDVRLLERAQIRDEWIYFRPTKTRESSGVELEIMITPEIRSVLDRAAAASKRMRVVCRYVIHTRGGTAFTRSGIYSAFHRAAKTTGIEGINPKSLRSFAATMAKRQGATLEDLQEGLGHTSVTTTEGYVRKHEVRRSKIQLTLPPETAKKA